MALISSFISFSVIVVCAISLFRYIMQIYCMGISVQIPRQARDDIKKLKRAGGQGESSGGQERELVDFMRRISKEGP